MPRVRPSHEFLQWFGLLGGAAAWAMQFVFGQGMTYAACNVASKGWGIADTTWQLAAASSAALVTVLALAASVVLYLRLRDVDSEPPAGRHVFFAYASIAGNVLFLWIILLSGLMSVYHFPCKQA